MEQGEKEQFRREGLPARAIMMRNDGALYDEPEDGVAMQTLTVADILYIRREVLEEAKRCFDAREM